MKTSIVVPVVGPPDGGAKVDAEPVVTRGIAVKRSEYLRTGPTPGRCGRKAIVRGDQAHNPNSPECQQRVVEWLKRPNDKNMHERLASAKVRQGRAGRASTGRRGEKGTK